MQEMSMWGVLAHSPSPLALAALVVLAARYSEEAQHKASQASLLAARLAQMEALLSLALPTMPLVVALEEQ
jgi:hypothetical protein